MIRDFCAALVGLVFAIALVTVIAAPVLLILWLIFG